MGARWYVCFATLFIVGSLLLMVQELPSANGKALSRVKRGWLYNIVAKGCKTAGEWTGWACDDPVSRRIWQEMKNCRGCNCDQFCKKAGKSRGRCVQKGNYDHSTWCPNKGEACYCN
ncbi:hypothetical protein RvY_09808 [Ramazzottius varieornatus]|uniref:Uncharacterized protein n=1 Tax=Ramazzottius varieornatus TaxID=947166 RepID=A0A1D1VAN5_RAMVA|nr:hypothetical protein RvY_09808 [Ramazzottius varieornatus]